VCDKTPENRAVHPLGDKLCVRMTDLSHEQFRTDGNDFCDLLVHFLIEQQKRCLILFIDHSIDRVAVGDDIIDSGPMVNTAAVTLTEIKGEIPAVEIGCPEGVAKEARPASRLSLPSQLPR
jgi:hypothetical protein